MLVAAAALGALAIAGLVTPWVLLALIFAVGTGQALTSPTWQTLQPELVPPAERPQAISLGAVNQNLARAVGPAIGGIMLAATSAGTVFLINAATFLAVHRRDRLVAQRPGPSTPCPASTSARRSGPAPATSPPARTCGSSCCGPALFVFFASAIWALLPLTAQSQLHLGSGGYGLLLGCVGVGAVAGAALLPGLRARLDPGTQLTAGSIGAGRRGARPRLRPRHRARRGGPGRSAGWPGSWPCPR